MNEAQTLMAEREKAAKAVVNASIIAMRRADMYNTGANTDDVTPLFVAYLRAKIIEIESWPGWYGEDIELVESMIAEIEAINPTRWIDGKPA